MALTEHYYTKFKENEFYHVYNRSIDKKAMFKNEGNYEFFLKQFDHYLSPVLETYSYCLLGNHFHLLVRIQDLTTFKKLSNLTKDKTPHDIVSHQFRKFFQSYAMAFNKQQDRTGTLFQTPFKRVWVDDKNYYTKLVYYIHTNPKLHGLIDDFREWKWSSYDRTLIDKPSKLKKLEVINWFRNKVEFLKLHATKEKFKFNEKYFFEDDDYLEI